MKRIKYYEELNKNKKFFFLTDLTLFYLKQCFFIIIIIKKEVRQLKLLIRIPAKRIFVNKILLFNWLIIKREKEKKNILST